MYVNKYHLNTIHLTKEINNFVLTITQFNNIKELLNILIKVKIFKS